MRPRCRGGWRLPPQIVAVALGSTLVSGTAGCTRARVADPPPITSSGQRPTPSMWEHFAEASAWPRVIERAPARGHATGEYWVDVRVAPAFCEEYRRLTAGQTLPVGTTIAAFHRNRMTGEAGSIYAMSKRSSGTWDYVVAEPNGAIVVRGDLPLCTRCHAEAPADSVFGARVAAGAPSAELPRSPQR